MHKYLRSVGFTNFIHYKDILTLRENIFENPDKIDVSDVMNSSYVTMEKDFAQHIGAAIFGEYDFKDLFHYEYIYPYYNGDLISCSAHCSFSRKTDHNAFMAICDDPILPIPLIFSLQNTGEYLEIAGDHTILDQPLAIHFTGFSVKGTILLPVTEPADKQAVQKQKAQRKSWKNEAMKGDQKALESLAIDDLNQYNKAARRFLTEDLYSIVSTSFMPTGLECDVYAVIGKILDFDLHVNGMTLQKVYHFLIEANEVQFDLLINEKDLTGEPAVGRRFKGEIWLQGRIDFSGPASAFSAGPAAADVSADSSDGESSESAPEDASANSSDGGSDESAETEGGADSEE